MRSNDCTSSFMSQAVFNHFCLVTMPAISFPLFLFHVLLDSFFAVSKVYASRLQIHIRNDSNLLSLTVFMQGQVSTFIQNHLLSTFPIYFFQW